MASRVETVAGFVLGDLVGSVVQFPLWWYGRGLFGVAGWAKDGLVYHWRSFAVALWLKNFFVPMYGAYHWSGRLISVGVRFVVIFARLVALALEAAVYLLILALWVMLPPFLLIMLLLNLYRGAIPSWGAFGSVL